MRFPTHAVFAVILSTWMVVCGRGEDASFSASDLEFFEKQVRPLLTRHCYECHSRDSKKVQAGLLMDSRAGLLRGGDSGPALVPGDAAASLMIQAVHYESYEMPPQGKCSDEEIDVLERWVERGAAWPDAGPDADLPSGEGLPAPFDLQHRRSQHWVWQPVQSPEIPSVINPNWPRSPIDHFILAKLEQAKLHPVADADRTALVRRLYFDLIGLPPRPDEVAEYLNDDTPSATEKLVDRLLDSPHFGEHWGRHWLDLVRYAESRGHEFDDDAPNAFQYRDFVIRALNLDVPYDQFVREHIAGDLLETPRLHPDAAFNESILGTGFWFLGEWVHSPVDIRKDEADRFDNMIDVMSKTFLGVTVACARCHDHKFDAISTADYYSLSGFLQSSDYRQVRFESLEQNREIAEQLAALDSKYQQWIKRELAALGVQWTKPQAIATEFAASVVVDYDTLEPVDFLQDGFIFGNQPQFAGEPFIETIDGKSVLQFASVSAATSDPFWNGLRSVGQQIDQNKDSLNRLPRSGRTLRTPTFELTAGNVACRVQGSGHVVACVDSHRLVAGPLHGQTIVEIKPSRPWTVMDLNQYVGHRIHLEFTPTEDAQLSVSMVVQGASKKALEALAQRELAIADAVQQYAENARQALAEQLGSIVDDWAQQRSHLHAQVQQRSQLAIAMLDGSGEDDHILIRGNASKPGKIEPRHFLTAISGTQPLTIDSGSGRLELARHINDPSNPLTSRVIVNRIWHHLIGRGIVATTDDFGVLGKRPTHPQLLDYLASRFITDGRSIKRTIRSIVLSRTYQMASHPSSSAIAADPDNLLVHHHTPKRLAGETIRDSMFVIADRLDRTQFGESIPVHLTSFMSGRGRPSTSGPLDGAGRRSIYTAVRRNFLSPFMLAFDTPTPFSTMGRRNVSNVPAQALIMMNDPLVIDLAEAWAQQILESPASLDSRVVAMYQSAFARPPTSSEQSIAVDFLNAEMGRRQVEQNDLSIWTDFAHALFNMKEFIFIR